MRRILVDHARARTRLKRGGTGRAVSLEPGDDVPVLNDIEAEEVLAIDVALERLARVNERARQADPMVVAAFERTLSGERTGSDRERAGLLVTQRPYGSGRSTRPRHKMTAPRKRGRAVTPPRSG